MKRVCNEKILSSYVSHPKISNMFSKNLLTLFELFYFEKGDFIIRQGFCSDYLYFIVSGKARVYTYTPSGNITLLSFSTKFQPLGESASLWGKEAVANVEAITDGYCVGISLIQYRNILLQDPIFLRNTCEFLANKLNQSNTVFADVFLGSIENRLAFYILHSCKNNVFSSNISECAEIMRTSYRHLLRILNLFCQNGILKKDGKNYIILEVYFLVALQLKFHF